MNMMTFMTSKKMKSMNFMAYRIERSTRDLIKIVHHCGVDNFDRRECFLITGKPKKERQKIKYLDTEFVVLYLLNEKIEKKFDFEEYEEKQYRYVVRFLCKGEMFDKDGNVVKKEQYAKNM